MTIRTYSLSQRCMVYVLLVSFFLQSCYNTGISTNPVDPIIGIANPTLDQALQILEEPLEVETVVASSIWDLPINNPPTGDLAIRQAPFKQEGDPFKQIAVSLHANQAFHTKPGQTIVLYKKQGAWKAQVKEQFGLLTRSLDLPVYFEGPSLPSALQPSQLHLLDRGLYVGKRGLVGGMIRKEYDNKGVGDEMQEPRTAEEKDTFLIPEKAIEIGQIMGRGAFGTVYQCKLRNNKGSYALKEVRLPYTTDREEQKKHIAGIHKELSILKELNHKNIVSLIGYHIPPEEDRFMLVMDLYNMSLRAYLTKLQNEGRWHKPHILLSTDDTKQVTVEVLEGLSYLHSKRIAHRDIKAENVLVSLKGLSSLKSLHLADFGISRAVEDTWGTMTIAGTPGYMAPEILSGKYDPFKTDIYAFGRMLYECVSGERPRGDVSMPPDSEQGYVSLVDMFEKCTQVDPKKRPDCEELLRSIQGKSPEQKSAKKPENAQKEEQQDKQYDKGQGFAKNDKEGMATTWRDWTSAPQIKTIKAHTSTVTTLIELSDGLLASGAFDRKIKLWDRAGKCINTITGHKAAVKTLIELSDGLLASGSYDNTIKIWDRIGNCIKTLEGHTDHVQTLIELSDGSLASGSDDKTIKIWDRAGNCMKTLEGHTRPVSALTELSDGSLASGSDDNTIKIWDKDRSGKFIKKLEGHTYTVRRLIELSDGLLASCSLDKTIKIWDRSGNCIKTLKGHTGGIFNTGMWALIELSDRRLASCAGDNTIKIWDRSGECINTLKGHTDGVRALIELSDGCLASGSSDNTIKIWEFPKT